MMKPRSNRIVAEAIVSNRNKAEAPMANGSLSIAQRNSAQLNSQQANVQNIRKRRSSINVYDQPSSLNSRLRQLETDMLRLDEDRTKLFDDTHSALAQYELKLSEIHAILKSRQDNVEKYVDDMKTLLQAKEEFEKQAKLLTEKHDRIHEKFMNRETTISREIKLLKNKFELLEKNRQFRSILQKSNTASGDNNEDLTSGLDPNDFSRNQSEASELGSSFTDRSKGFIEQKSRSSKNVRIKLSKIGSVGNFFSSIIGVKGSASNLRRKSNRVSSILMNNTNNAPVGEVQVEGNPTILADASVAEQINEIQNEKKNKKSFLKRLFG